MKLNTAVFLAVMVAGATFLSGASQANAPSLKDKMKSIKVIFVNLGKNAANASQNAASAAQSAQLADLFTATLNDVPDSIASLPQSQRDQAIADYKSLIQKEVVNAQSLQQAFLSNDNAGAASILKDMSAIKSTGHSKYAD